MWVLWWHLGLLLALFFVGNDLDSCPQANAHFGPCRAASLCNYQLRIKSLCAGRWACGEREDNYSQIKQQCLGKNQHIIHSQWAQRSHTKAHTPLKQELCRKSSAGSIWGQTALLLAQHAVDLLHFVTVFFLLRACPVCLTFSRMLWSVLVAKQKD